MDTWESIASLDDFGDYRFIKAPVPVYDQADYDLAFQRCRENRCGTYDTNWGCNPGAKRDVAEYYKGIDYVVVMSRRFEMDYHDTGLLASVSEDMQRGCRRFVLRMRDNGIDCDGFLDGPCLYCGECSYPEPCRFPDMIMPSVSTLGIDLGKYFEGIGEPFSFQEGVVTLYGFVFVKRPSAQ